MKPWKGMKQKPERSDFRRPFFLGGRELAVQVRAILSLGMFARRGSLGKESWGDKSFGVWGT